MKININNCLQIENFNAAERAECEQLKLEFTNDQATIERNTLSLIPEPITPKQKEVDNIIDDILSLITRKEEIKPLFETLSESIQDDYFNKGLQIIRNTDLDNFNINFIQQYLDGVSDYNKKLLIHNNIIKSENNCVTLRGLKENKDNHEKYSSILKYYESTIATFRENINLAKDILNKVQIFKTNLETDKIIIPLEHTLIILYTIQSETEGKAMIYYKKNIDTTGDGEIEIDLNEVVESNHLRMGNNLTLKNVINEYEKYNSIVHIVDNRWLKGVDIDSDKLINPDTGRNLSTTLIDDIKRDDNSISNLSPNLEEYSQFSVNPLKITFNYTKFLYHVPLKDRFFFNSDNKSEKDNLFDRNKILENYIKFVSPPIDPGRRRKR